VPYFPAICGGLVRYAGDGLLYLLLGVLEVHELARQVLLVGGEVEVPVSAEVEEYDLPPGLRARGLWHPLWRARPPARLFSPLFVLPANLEKNK
jgi:hypothetical protein